MVLRPAGPLTHLVRFVLVPRQTYYDSRTMSDGVNILRQMKYVNTLFVNYVIKFFRRAADI